MLRSKSVRNLYITKTKLKMLKLKKEQVAVLSNTEMQQVTGGGIKRSNRRTGNCRYSRNHPHLVTCCGETRVLGCLTKMETPAHVAG